MNNTQTLCLGRMQIIIQLFFFVFLHSTTLFAQYENVVLNETSGDGGNIEARNDAIVELAGPPGTDIGCMVITDTEWAIVLPAGATIPADGVFIIGCGSGNNGGNASYTVGSVKSGLSCDVCDFPGLIVDFDVCDSRNENYLSPSMNRSYGFTLDNIYCRGNRDGEQVMLFRPDGTPHDAIYWGAPDPTLSNGGATTFGGASGKCGSSFGADHVSVQIGVPYTLGDNDNNGIINDYTGSHLGFRADGGNATGVNVMPSGNDDFGNPVLAGIQIAVPPGDCNADQISYTVPSLADPIWIDVGLTLVSCNSTHIRINDTSPTGNSEQLIRASTNSSHMDDPDLNENWVAYTPTALTPSSVDPVIAAMQWQVTNHPNPGQPNDADSWDFFVDIENDGFEADDEIREKSIQTIVLCTPQALDFQLQVFNYQHVEPVIRTTNKAGSYINDENGVDQAWTVVQVGSMTTDMQGTMVSAEDGVTTLQYSTGILSIGEHEFELIWDDYTDCCGSSNNSTVTNSSNPHECYEKISVQVEVVDNFVVTQNAVACPDDFQAGTINISNIVTGGYQVQYELFIDDMALANPPSIVNNTGVFSLPTGVANNDIRVRVTSQAPCPATEIVVVNLNCIAPPICPENYDITIGTTVDGSTLCPEDNVTLCFSGDMLPIGGQVNWTLDGTNEVVGTLPVPNPTCPTVIGAYINACNTGNGEGLNEYAVVKNGSSIIDPDDLFVGYGSNSPGADINATTIANNDAGAVAIVASFNADCPSSNPFILVGGGDQIPADAIILLMNGENFPDFDFDFSAADICNSTIYVMFGTGGWRTNGFFANNPSTDRIFTASINGNASCSGNSVAYSNNITGYDNIDGQSVSWSCNGGMLTPTSVNEGDCDTNPASANGSLLTGDQDISCIPATGGSFSGSLGCITYQLPTDVCNTNPTFRATLTPFPDGCPNDIDDENTGDAGTIAINVTCPTADLVPLTTNQCVGDGAVEVMVNLGGLTTGDYCLTYIDATENPQTITVPATASGTTTATITIPDASTNGEKDIFLTRVFADLDGDCSSTSAGECMGNIDFDVATIQINVPPAGQLTAATDLTDCDRDNDPTGQGSLTFEFTGDGIFIFQYSINGGDAIEAETNLNSFTFPVDLAGNYELLSITNDAGCTGTLGAMTMQTIQTPGPVELLSITADNTIICSDNAAQNTTTVDLSSTVDFTIDLDDDDTANVNGNYNEINADATSGTIRWYSTDAYPLGSIGRQSVEITGADLVVSPPQTQNYYFIYTHTDNCEVSRQLTITVNETPDLSANASITNTCPSETVDLTDTNITGFMDNNSATSGATGTISYHTIANPANENDSTVPNAKMAATGATYYIRKEVNNCTDIVAIQVTTTACPKCPIIGDLDISAATVCSGDEFVLVASGLEMMAQSDNNQNDYGIRFIAYPPNATISNPYTDNNVQTLGIVPFSQLTDNNSTATLTDLTISTPTGNYQIFAVLNPAPTQPANCHPARSVALTVNPLPDLSANASITNTCPSETVDLTDTNITGFMDNNSATSGATGTISYHTIANPADENDSTVPNAKMAATGATYYIRKEINNCTDIVAIQVTTTACPKCPIIGDLDISAATICSGDEFILVASDLEMMAQSDNNQNDYGIRFIAYPPNATISNPYTDNNVQTLGIIPFSQLTDNNSTATLTDLTISTPTGNYQIFAVLNPAPTQPANCHPARSVALTVNPVPELTVNSPIINTCPSETVDLTDTQLTGLHDNNASTNNLGTISYHTVANPSDANDNTVIDPTRAAAGNTYYIRKEINNCTDIVEIVVNFTSCVMCPIITNLTLSNSSICRNENLSLTIDGLSMFDFNANAQANFGLRIITYPLGVSPTDPYADTNIIELTKVDFNAIQNNNSVTINDLNINLPTGDYQIYVLLDAIPTLVNCQPFQFADLNVRSRPEDIVLPPMACNDQLNISLSRTCGLQISVDALLEAAVAQENTFYTINIGDNSIHIGDAIDGTTNEDVEQGFVVSIPDTGLIKYNIVRCTEIVDCDANPLVIKENCWGNILIEDKSNPFCNPQLEEEKLITFDVNGNGIIEEDERLVNDPSGVDDLLDEYILCSLIERNGVDIYFDELEARDTEIDYDGDEVIDQVLLADFTDCSGIQSIGFTDNITEVCELSDLQGLPINTTRFNVDSFEIVKVYQRTWTAIDATGIPTAQACSQYVFALRPKFLQLPQSVLIDCDSTLVANSGAPFFTVINNKTSGIENGGQGSDQMNVLAVTNYTIGAGQNSCGYTVSHHIDPQIPLCTNSFKQNRHWTVVDWCNGNRVYDEFTQLLKVVDSTPPILISENGFPLFTDAAGVTREERGNGYDPSYTIQLGTQLFDCFAEGNLPLFTLTDNCSVADFSRITIERTTDENTFVVGEFFINNFLADRSVNGVVTDLGLPTGTYTVTYFFNDDCGNAATLEVPLNLTDNRLPAPICNDELVVTLIATDTPNEQRARVYAEDLDDTSRDACFPLISEVRLGDGSNQAWGEFVEFTCADAITANTVTQQKVELRITEDRNGNNRVDNNELSNTCWTFISIEDKTPPKVIIENVALTCDDPLLNNLQLTTGVYSATNPIDSFFPSVLSGCSTDDISIELLEVDQSAFDPICKVGILNRTFRAIRTIHNNIISGDIAEQQIEVRYNADWTMRFPADKLVSCGSFEQTEVINQSGAFSTLAIEEILTNHGCDQWAMEVEDDIFDISGADADGACFKIVRNYTFINWCTWNPTHTEVGIVPRPLDFFTDESLTITLDYQSDPVIDLCLLQNKIDDRFERHNDPYDLKIGNNRNNIIDVLPAEIDADFIYFDENEFGGTAAYRGDCITDGHNIFFNQIIDIDVNTLNPLIADNQQHQFVSAEAYGYFTYRQIIKVADDDAPIIQPIADLTVCDSTNLNDNCSIGITFPLPTVEECKSTYRIFWSLDVFQTGTFTTTGELSRATDNTFEPLTLPTVPYGTHTLRYEVVDGCGNSAFESFNFTAKDCKAPTAYCVPGVNLDIMPTGMVCLWASDLDAGSFDDCSEPIQLSFSPNPLDTGMKFTCAQRGSNSINLYVTDAVGNQSICRTLVTIQTDLLNECSNGAAIRGNIYTEIGEQVENVMVHLDGQQVDSVINNISGDYRFSDLQMGMNYSVTPSKVDYPTNGVSTFDLILIQKHIMGIQLLDSPYKLIAADVNRSGSITTLDMIQIRRLIMGLDTEFTHNTSWRFVAADYDFPNPANPWLAPFPEAVVYEHMNNAMNDHTDFIAVKIGDVNYSAIPYQSQEIEERNTIVATSNSHKKNIHPLTIQLLQNSPNPFSEYTNIRFYLPTITDVEIIIYDTNGGIILATKETLKAGVQQIPIDEMILDNMNNGVYFYTLKTSNFVQTKKMILQK